MSAEQELRVDLDIVYLYPDHVRREETKNITYPEALEIVARAREAAKAEPSTKFAHVITQLK